MVTKGVRIAARRVRAWLLGFVSAVVLVVAAFVFRARAQLLELAAAVAFTVAASLAFGAAAGWCVVGVAALAKSAELDRVSRRGVKP